MTTMGESGPASALKSWLSSNGGDFHPDAHFFEDASGYRIVAAQDIPADTSIVSCPFNLVVTPELCRRSIFSILEGSTNLVNNTAEWTERQWIATYLSLHWIIKEDKQLNHNHYLNTLPRPDQLRTPLHFSVSELELFRGSNLYGATLDREREWRSEWEQCLNVTEQVNKSWGREYTWDKYLTCATYISSRAFPSSLLSSNPTLAHAPSTYPVLIPGVDSLNHARGHPVSWLVTQDGSVAQELKVTILHHQPVIKGQELFNNYGPKPNAELILGYGFSLPNNPDDTIVLKLGGIDGAKRWEVGRNAHDSEGIWKELLSTFVENDRDEPTYEDILDASGALQEMVGTLLARLPTGTVSDSAHARPEVVEMFLNYLEGQKDILQSLLAFAKEREDEAVELAREQGIDVVLEDYDE